MWCNEDSNGEETVSANHLSGRQFSAEAQYHVNYGNAVTMVEVDRCNQNTSNTSYIRSGGGRCLR